MRASTRDIAAGAVFVAFGAAFGSASLNYDLGSAFRMGPGYMPLVLAGLLVVLGLAVGWSGWRKGGPDEASPIPWRAFALLGTALLLFGFCARGLGLVPVVVLVTALAALASRENGPGFALAVGIGMAVLCTAIFWYGLGISLPLVGPWLPIAISG